MYVRSILAYESSVFKAYTLYCIYNCEKRRWKIYFFYKKDVGRFILLFLYQNKQPWKKERLKKYIEAIGED